MKMWWTSAVCLVPLLLVQAARAEIYTSLTCMSNLFSFDKMVGEALPLMPEFTPEIEGYTESYSRVAADRMRWGAHELDLTLTGNPLHIFALVKRLVLFWPAISREFHSISNAKTCEDFSDHCQRWAEAGECKINTVYMKINCRSSCHLCPPPELLAIVERVREAEKSTLLPTGDDLRGTAIAIARLRRIYRLAITDLVDGRLLDAVTSARLTIYDCLMIADESFKAKDFTSAWLWSRYAWTATTNPEMKAYVSRLMAAVSKEHDDTWNGETDHFPARLSEGQSQVPHDITYDRLCRGEHFMSEEEGTGLRCRVSAMGQPHLVLQPVKYEQLHFDPEMYLFYDVLSDSEIQAIKDSALSKLFRSGTLAPEVYSDIRVSQTAWLTNASHPLLPGICRRISAITGLNVFEGPDGSRAGEDLQVLSYGVGGHYIYHVDVLFKNLPEDQWHETTAGAHVIQDGDRMATWMFYLSDVERGGRTAFPKAGISVPPVKGAAVMWFNLKKNGDVNPRAEHGGCPVLLGHKWVANKWIREHANFLKRPCSIQPFE